MKHSITDLTPSDPLPPGAIIGAAASDLKSREHNARAAKLHAEIRAEGGATEIPPPYKAYAFHRTHVRAAGSPAELIELALNDRKRGLKARKRSTLELYSNEPALRAALERARTSTTQPAKENTQ